MPRWAIPPNLHSEIIGGPLCYFREHSIGSRDGRIPRYTDSHACVRCISALTEGRLSLDVHKIHPKHRRRFLEFWSFVAIGEPDQCWPWQGATHAVCSGSTWFGIQRHWCAGRQFSAPRVATWFSWGDIGRLPIKNVCEDPFCCNPLHIRVVGVPHYYHNRKLQLVDLEFNSRKLLHETSLFLQTARQKTPARFKTFARHNHGWILKRIEQGEATWGGPDADLDPPVDPSTLLEILAEAEEDTPDS